MTGTCTAVGIFLESAISTKKKLRKYFTDFILQTMYPRVHHSFHFDFVLGRQKKLELRVLTMWTHGWGSRNNNLDTFLGAV